MLHGSPGVYGYSGAFGFGRFQSRDSCKHAPNRILARLA
jgi:hypothetical protein